MLYSSLDTKPINVNPGLKNERGLVTIFRKSLVIANFYIPDKNEYQNGIIFKFALIQVLAKFCSASNSVSHGSLP